MNQNQLEIPIQPVERPILCSPYEEPNAHWVYDTETGEAIQQPGRRVAVKVIDPRGNEVMRVHNLGEQGY